MRREVVDEKNGRKWEIIKHDEDRFTVNYYEFYKALGWRKLGTERNCSREYIEWQFDIIVP